MKALSFETGVVEYEVNGECTITFCPSSDAFTKRFLDLMDRLKAIETLTPAEEETIKRTPEKAFEFSANRTEKINAEIDGLFGAGSAASLFPAGPRAHAGGFPAWLNFCLCILDELHDNAEALDEQANARMAKYMDKYKKYQKI